MKRLFIILSAAALIAGAGCSNNESEAPADGYGRLSIDCSASDDITAGIQAAAPAGPYAPTRAGIPAGEEFALRITGTDYDRSWETLATFLSEEELFVKGSYTAAVTWGNPAEEGFGKYSYAGEREFTIQPRQTTEVHITASIVNSQVLVRTTEQFRRYFHDARFNVTTGSENSFDFTFEKGTDDPDQADEALCVAAATSLAVNGSARRQSATGTDQGSEVTFPEQRLDATTPRTRHIFEYDAADAGSATLKIYIGVDENGNDLLVETRVIEVELNDDSIKK